MTPAAVVTAQRETTAPPHTSARPRLKGESYAFRHRGRVMIAILLLLILLVLLFGSGAVLTGLGIAAAIFVILGIIGLLCRALFSLFESGGISESEHRAEEWPPAKQRAADERAAASMNDRERRRVGFILSGILALIVLGVIIYQARYHFG